LFPPPPGFGGFPPPPQRRRSGLRTALFVVGAIVVFGGIFLGGIVLIGTIAGAGAGSSPMNRVVKETVQSGASDQVVAIIPVNGLIIDETESAIARYVAAAEEDTNIKAVVLHVSSPGGTVTDSNQIYENLLRLKENRPNLPIVAHFDDVAASGGYYVACAADEIVAEETTITGSIGVLIQYPQLSVFAEKTGIRFQTIVADGSPKKAFLDTFEEPDDADLADVKSLLNKQYDIFRDVVEAGRGSKIREAGSSVDEVASGAVFVGEQALELGLVDKIGMISDATGSAAALAGLRNPKVVRFGRPPTVLEQIGLAEAKSLDLQGESAKSLAVELLHEATSPRVLYLYNGAR
ncbi:MAG: signal peptide peptidase SppA, partial [Planctomycetota bacterium]